MSKNSQSFVNQLRKDLLNSRRARDALASDALRSVLNEIDNASAVPIPDDASITEAPRRELSLKDIISIIDTEIDEMQQAAEQFASVDDTRKNELDAKISLLKQYLDSINS